MQGAPGPWSARSWLGFLAGFAVLCGVLLGTSAVDATGRWGLAILAAVLVTAMIVERIRCRCSIADTLRRLGLGRPGGRALLLALGVFAFHGLAEELVWRGFAFRRLREGRSFWAATCWTMPLIAVTHVPIVVTMGPAVGVGALAVAAVTSMPLAYLYETGRRTIWAPALVHTAIDTFKLVLIPAAALPTFSLLIIVVSLTVPLLAFAVPRNVLTASKSRPRSPTWAWASAWWRPGCGPDSCSP